MRRKGDSALHDLLIEHYVSLVPGTQRHGFEGFAKRLEKQLDYFELEGTAFPLGFTPDAFRVDHESQEIWLVEAEVTSRIGAAKWEAINEYRLRIVEYDDWDVWVHVVDRAGAVFSVNTPLLRTFSAREEFEAFAKAPMGRHVWLPGLKQQPAWRAIEWPRAHWLPIEDLRGVPGLEDVVDRHERADAAAAKQYPFTGKPLVDPTPTHKRRAA